MKKAILLFVALLTFGTTQAQDFEKGGKYVSIGYGLDPWGHHTNNGNIFGNNSNYRKTSIGPSILMFEYGLTDILGIGRIGVGGGFAHSIYTQKWSSNSSNYVLRDTRQRLSVIARAAYHFEFDIEKMDVYAGVGAAVHHYTDKESDDNFINTKSTSVGVGHYVFAGIRYYFTDFFGVYAEAGHGLAAVNGGIIFSF